MIRAYKWKLTFTNQLGEERWIKSGAFYHSDKYQAFDDLWCEVMYANAGQASWDDFIKNKEKYPHYYYPIKFERLDDEYVDYDETLEGDKRSKRVHDIDGIVHRKDVTNEDEQDWYCWEELLDELEEDNKE